MSRFFDILREATRSGSNPDANPQKVSPEPKDDQNAGEEVWNALGLDVALPSTGKTGTAREAGEEPGNGTVTASTWTTTPEQLFESFGRPESQLVGTAAKVSFDTKARLIPNAIDAVVVEHYRRLRTKIIQQQESMPFKVLLVTSPNPQEGKSVTVMNLGLSFAKLPDFKVLIVDGDLRRASLGRWLGIESQPGLSNLLDGSASVENTVFKCDDSPLHFMTQGTSEASPGELLQSARLKSTFHRLGETFDLVLVDSPPLNLMTDATLLAGACEAVLLIVRAYSTNRKAFDKAIQELRPFRMIGTVLNGGTRSSSRYKGYYYH
jgi:capsular exopolysaccharide synthesis family protein